MTDITDLKPARPMAGVDLTHGFKQIPGAAEGILCKPLSGALDETARRGARTRLIRFEPGTRSEGVVSHDYWEEAYLIQGRLIIDGEEHGAPSYACRPPGTPHGPFASPGGCLLLEIQFYT